MNRAIVKRWINEYLDGEIGLADKAELERIMAAYPEVRREYKELRRIGLLLGSMPEITVHPQRFRHRVKSTLDARERSYFTPQRAWAAAMFIALLVVGLTFSLFMYQQQILGRSGFITNPPIDEVAAPGEVTYDLKLAVGASPERFFNRLLLECDLGLIDHSTLEPFLSQAHVYEGAVCSRQAGLTAVTFPMPLPSNMRVRLKPADALALANLAEELTGDHVEIGAMGRDGSSISSADFFQLHSGADTINLYLHFK